MFTKPHTLLARLSMVTGLLVLAVIPTLDAAPASNGRTELPFGSYVPAIDTASRDQVAMHYHQYYYWPGFFDDRGRYTVYDTFPIAANWTGNTEQCIAGTINPAMRQAGVRQLNYFRALVGLTPARVADEATHRASQEAALIVGANAVLNHYPTPDYRCYSPLGAEGAAGSNLAYTLASVEYPTSLGSYISDPGDDNAEVGHRRTFLYPPVGTLAYASTEFRHPLAPDRISGANAVGGTYTGFTGKKLPAFVAWPNPGFMPFQLMPASSNRWSFTCTECDFSRATVAMTKDGVAMAALSSVRPYADGFGDNTLVWEPVGVDYSIGRNELGLPTRVPLAREATYEVTVHHVGVPSCITAFCDRTFTDQDFTYRVTVFDPEQHIKTQALPRANYSDLWWNERESGQGYSINQGASGALFGTWFIYDATGKPMWVVMPGGQWQDSTTFVGKLYTTTGTPYADPFIPGRFQVSEAGTATLRFNDDAHATLTYTLNGVSGTKDITRQMFGAPTYTDGKNFSGLWNNDPDETGWGIGITQQWQTIFATAYIYDEAGLPTWFVLPGGEWTSSSTYEGTIYITSGPAFDAPFDPGQVRVEPAGTARLVFTNDTSGVLTYTLNGKTVTKPIKRLQF